jgi:S-adenosylmethionine decarboxylase
MNLENRNVDVVMKKNITFNNLKLDMKMLSNIIESPYLVSDDEAEIISAGHPETVNLSADVLSEGQLDHFVEQDGMVFAGRHLIVDLWGASKLDEIEYIKTTLEEIIRECGATLLHIHLHRFTENGGVSGVALLAESHISIHTWPERNYAALDVFMCGDASPHRAIAILKEAFQPTSVQVADHKRGVIV